MAQILARYKKSNPILLGEPGVGKTAIAEGLAKAIAEDGRVNGEPLPEPLKVRPHMPFHVPPHAPHRPPRSASTI